MSSVSLKNRDNGEKNICTRPFEIKDFAGDNFIVNYGEMTKESGQQAFFIIPGSLSTALTWKETAESLMERDRENEFGKLVCVTPFGMNGSRFLNGKNPDVYEIGIAYADLIKNIFTNGEKLTIISHSKGDAEALFLNMSAKDYTERFIFVSPVMNSGMNVPNMIVSSLGSFRPFEDIYKTMLLIKESTRTSLKGLLHQIMETDESKSINLREDFGKINVPVFVIGSQNDIATEEELKRFADIFPNSNLKILNNGGHHLPFYHPEEFANVVWNWIESQYKTSI